MIPIPLCLSVVSISSSHGTLGRLLSLAGPRFSHFQKDTLPPMWGIRSVHTKHLEQYLAHGRHLHGRLCAKVTQRQTGCTLPLWSRHNVVYNHTRIHYLKERNVQPVSNSGPPERRLPQDIGGGKEVYPGIRCGATLCPAWHWVAFRPMDLCVPTEPCPCARL